MAVNSEIAGMGKVRLEENGDIVVEDVMIYDQEVTSGTADLSPTALANWMTEMVQRGESLAPWILWWHSHHTMSAFFSGRDTGTIDGSTEFSHLISLVVNTRRERKCRVDTYRPFRLVKEDVPIVIGTSSDEVPEAIKDEVREKVRFERPQYTNRLGFHDKNHGGKDQERESWNFGRHSLFPRNNEKSSANGSIAPKENGGNASGVILAEASKLDHDEIMAVIEVLEDQRKTMERQGKKETEQYEDLVDEISDWRLELSVRSTLDAYEGRN